MMEAFMGMTDMTAGDWMTFGSLVLIAAVIAGLLYVIGNTLSPWINPLARRAGTVALDEVVRAQQENKQVNPLSRPRRLLNAVLVGSALLGFLVLFTLPYLPVLIACAVVFVLALLLKRFVYPAPQSVSSTEDQQKH